jgi:hypothetical protein
MVLTTLRVLQSGVTPNARTISQIFQIFGADEMLLIKFLVLSEGIASVTNLGIDAVSQQAMDQQSKIVEKYSWQIF